MARRFLLLLLPLSFAAMLHAAVYKTARHVSVVETSWCDIIFTEECAASAALIAREADGIFDRMAEMMQMKHKFRLPVVISCDSETPSVSYTPVPYNRIVMYCTPSIDAPDGRDVSLLAEFTREASRAVAQCNRGPIEQVISFMFSDAVQPSYLVNMPLSYFEGLYSTIGEGKCGDGDGIEHISDREALAILVRAKEEGRFPTWINAAGARDIYPSTPLARAAGSAFAAYIQQRWGMAKYIALWKQSGRFHLFRLNAGLFRKVYGISLKAAWRNFADAVPLPQAEESEEGEVISKHAGEEIPLYIASGPLGTVYYCEARGEVMRLASSAEQSQTEHRPPKWKRLFFYTGVTSLSLSRDGRLLAVSHLAQGERENLKRLVTNVYDIETQEKIGVNHRMNHAVMIGDTLDLVAGVRAEGENSVFAVEMLDGTEVFRRPFEAGDVPRLVSRIDGGKVAILISHGASDRILVADTQTNANTLYDVPKNIVITSLQSAEGSDAPKAVFSYLLRDEVSYPRLGIFQFGTDEAGKCVVTLQAKDEKGGFSSCSLQAGTVQAGTVQSGTVCKDTLIYARRCAECSVLVRRPLDTIEMEAPFALEIAEGNKGEPSFPAIASVNDYTLKRYNPFKYIMSGTWFPMLPLYSFSLKDGYQLSPGYGVTYMTNQDATECAEGVLSFGTAFADPSTDYTEIIDDYSLSAYIKLSVLPVDIAAGSTWRWNKSGRYTLQTLAAAQWTMPLPEVSEHWTFDFRTLWTCRTDKANTDGTMQSKPSWAGVADAFNTIDFSLGSEYNNYRRSGMSGFEQLGFAMGGKVIFSYDLDEAFDRLERITEPSRLRLVGSLGIKVPRLIPVPYRHHLVLSLPLDASTTFDIDLTGTDGAVLTSFAEVLLIGSETQTGIPGINLYLARAGLSAGYEVRQMYDIVLDKHKNIWSNLDFYDNSFGGIVTNSQRYDYVYLAGRLVVSPVAGMLTRLKITAGSRLRLRLKDGEADASLILNVMM